MTQFKWCDTGDLVDGDLELVLVERSPADPEKELVPVYNFVMRHRGQPQDIGRISLRIGNTDRVRIYGGHCGYEVNTEYRGHRYAARSVRLLLPLAKRHGLEELWITCNPENIASRRTCELAGAEFVEIVDLPQDNDMYPEGDRQKCRYRIELT